MSEGSSLLIIGSGVNGSFTIVRNVLVIGVSKGGSCWLWEVMCLVVLQWSLKWESNRRVKGSFLLVIGTEVHANFTAVRVMGVSKRGSC